MSKISERNHHLMKVLVETYLRHGQPVGSGTLAKLSGLSVSAATIRNILGSLEQQGLITSPHTSAGRVPTNRGYRLFVDHLLTVKDVQRETRRQLHQSLKPNQTPERLFNNASQLLSELTHMAGLVRIPSRQVTRIKQIEFVPLTEKQVLVVLVLSDNEVQNRVIHTERPISTSELVEASNFINQFLVGQDLSSARQTLLNKMKQEQQQLNSMMQLAIELAGKGMSSEDLNDGYRVAGDKNLLDMADGMLDLQKLKAIFDAFQQKQQVLALLDKALNAEGVQIFIGDECATDGLDACSVVTAPYEIEGKPVGVLAVVGPTRMRYDKVIPIVDITAKMLSSALNHSN